MYMYLRIHDHSIAMNTYANYFLVVIQYQMQLFT